MRILILGGDGYLGWPTAMRFENRGHEVHVVDDYLRRRAHAEAGTDSLVPILPDLSQRVDAWKDVIAAYYPGGGWVRVHTDTLDALSARKAARGHHSYDSLITELLGP